MFQYEWYIVTDQEQKSRRVTGAHYSSLTVDFDEDTQRYCATLWGETTGSYYDQPCEFEVDCCWYDSAAAAMQWCEGMDIIGYGQSVIYEIPMTEMEEKMKENNYGA